MEESFLTMVRNRGLYRPEGEASRAVNSVFGTAKAWLPPAVSDVMRKMLPSDASRIWRYSPVAFNRQIADGDGTGDEPLRFVLKVQQFGGYETSGEARRAVSSVMDALTSTLPRGSARFLGRVFPTGVHSGMTAGFEKKSKRSRAGAGYAA